MTTHVLMINPELAFTVSLKQALERTGAFSVHPFTTPDAAFDYLQSHAQDVALVDFSLPTMSGEEIIRRLREIQPDISVVATPRQPDPVSRAFNLQGSLDKPYTARDVIPLLNRAAGARPTARTRQMPPPRGTADLSGGRSGITALFTNPDPSARPDPLTFDPFADQPDQPAQPRPKQPQPGDADFDWSSVADYVPPPSTGADAPPFEPESPAAGAPETGWQPEPLFDEPAGSESLSEFSSVELSIPDWLRSVEEAESDLDAELALDESPEFDSDSLDDFVNLIRDDAAAEDDDAASRGEGTQAFADFHLPGITDRADRERGSSQPVPPDTLPESQPVYLSDDEPPLPSFEDSGTISDLMTGATDAGFRNVLAILRGEDVPAESGEAAASITDDEMEEIFSSFYGDDDDDDDGDNATLGARADTSPAYDPFRAFDTESDDDDGPTPAQVILETALDDSTPDSFSLDSIIRNIDRQLPSHRPDVNPLPSWTKQGIPTFEPDIEEPDFLPPEDLPEPFMVNDSSPSAAFADQTTLPAGGGMTEPATDFVTETWEESPSDSPSDSPSQPVGVPEMDAGARAESNEFGDDVDAESIEEPDWLTHWPGEEFRGDDWSDVFKTPGEAEPEGESAEHVIEEADSPDDPFAAEVDLSFFESDFESDQVAVATSDQGSDQSFEESFDESFEGSDATVRHVPAVADAELHEKSGDEFAAEADDESDEKLRAEATVPHVPPDFDPDATIPPEPLRQPPTETPPPLVQMGEDEGYDSALYDTDFERMAAFDFPDAIILEHAPDAASDGGSAPASDEFLPDSDPEKAWLALLALNLTQVSLELTAHASLLTRGEDIVAIAGDLSDDDVQDLRSAVGNDWDAAGKQARIRFIRLDSSGKDYLLYSIATVDDLTLSMMFAGTTPLRDIRRQSRRLTDALAAVPEPASASDALAAPTQAGVSVQGTKPHEVVKAIEAPPAADAVALTRYSVVWLLRDPRARLSERTAHGLEAALRTQLQEHGWTVERIEVRDEYVSLLADLPSDRPAKDLIRELKSRSAELAGKLDPSLDAGDLWAPGYLMVMPGRALEPDEIQQFIAFERM